MATEPHLSLEESFYWEAFQVLHMSRQATGFGPGAILLSELNAYADILQVPSGDERCVLMRMIRAMDRSYLEQVKK